MSDLNDLIATNAINSFNSGLQTGISQERKRIIELLENSTLSSLNKLIAIPLIKGEQK